jgi:hypothetical protein
MALTHIFLEVIHILDELFSSSTLVTLMEMGKDEAAIYNSIDWSMEYLGLLVDNGNNGLR